MNPPLPDSLDRKIADLVRRARADVPPPVDTHALLRVLRAEPASGAAATATMAGRKPWWGDFAGLFETRAASVACGLSLACAAVVMWQAWSLWQDVLPWAQLAGGGELPLIGGGS